MKLTKLKIGIISVATLTIVAGGVGTYALIGSNKQQAAQNKVNPVITDAKDLTPIEPSQTDTVAPLPETTAEAITEAPAPAPEPAPVTVRSFEEIVKDYPNMSTGAPGFPECAGYLKNGWPEMFQDHNREENIKRISQKFYNVCSAIELKMNRNEMRILADHFKRDGVY